MDWDWGSRPTYESERLGVDGTLSSVVLYNMKQPRLVEDHEIELMLDLADFQIETGLPFVGLVRHERGTGVIAARHRQTFAEWLVSRRDALKRDDLSVVVVAPEPIYRAVLRVVYRFRTPPIRTITTPDLSGAAQAVRAELQRMGQPIGPEIEGFLDTLAA
ncbi:MAG: hypothetical protein WBB42_18685 [Polyangiales bacterium]